MLNKSWSDPTADIIGDLLALNALSERAFGAPIETAFIGSLVLGYMGGNPAITAEHPVSARKPAMSEKPGPVDGSFLIRLYALPWLNLCVDDNASGLARKIKIVAGGESLIVPVAW